MTKSLITFRSSALGLIVTALALVPAQARAETLPPQVAEHATTPAAPAVVPATPAKPATPGAGLGSVDTSACAQLPFSQPFASFGDEAFYTLAPGQSVGDFTGAGWSLYGGADIVSTRLRDGSTGQVLNLPGGSSAVSPPMCVKSNYPTGRTMIRDVAGFAGVQFQVAYKGSRSWVKPRHTGLVHGNSKAWTLSHVFDLRPYRTTGWQIVRFRLSVRKHTGDYELYNLYVDPHMVK